MSTQLQIINEVLIELREEEVASVAVSGYTKLLGQFVNKAIRFMENEWFWTQAETQTTTSVLADGTIVYSESALSNDAWMIEYPGSEKPLAYDITDTANPYQLTRITARDQRRRRRLLITTTEQPTEFATLSDTTNGGIQLLLPVGSTTARTWQIYWYSPQGKLALDGTANDTEINLPEFPLQQLVLYYALYERGEAQPGGKEETEALHALASAIEQDQQHSKEIGQRDMTNLEMLRGNTDWCL